MSSKSIIIVLLIAVLFLPASQIHAQASPTRESLLAEIQRLLGIIEDLERLITLKNGGGVNRGVMACPALGRNLGRGMEGADVSALQRFLANDRSLYPEALTTGYFGALTERAVERFQARHNIVSNGTPATTGYGAVGPRTRAMITKFCSQITIENNDSRGTTSVRDESDDERDEEEDSSSNGTVNSDDGSDSESPETAVRTFYELATTPYDSPALANAVRGRDIIETFTGADGNEVRLVIRKPEPLRSASQIFNIQLPSNSLSNYYEFLRGQFEMARARGARKIVFPNQATLPLKSPSGEPHLSIENFSDLEIDFNHSKLIFEGGNRGIYTYNLKRVVLRDGVITYKSPAVSLAVVRTDPNTGDKSFKVMSRFVPLIENGSLPNTILNAVLATYTSEGRWLQAIYNRDGASLNERSDGRDRYTYDPALDSFVPALGNTVRIPFAVGDYVLLKHFADGIALQFLGRSTEDVTVEGMTFQNLHGLTMQGHINRGLHLSGNTLRPTPNDHANIPDIGGTRDFAIFTSEGDVLIENNTLDSIGDDAFSISGRFVRVTSVNQDANTFTTGLPLPGLSRRDELFAEAGHTFAFLDDSYRFLGYSTATRNADVRNAAGNSHTVFVDDVPTSVKEGDLVANMARAAKRVIIRDNTLTHGNRAGVQFGGSTALIENNTFSYFGRPGVVIGSDMRRWYSGVKPSNVLVRDNRFHFTASAKNNLGKPDIELTVTDESARNVTNKVIENVTLKGNRYITNQDPCIFEHVTAYHGDSVTFYDKAFVDSPDSCTAHSQVRSCMNGVWSGSDTYSKTSCTLH